MLAYELQVFCPPCGPVDIDSSLFSMLEGKNIGGERLTYESYFSYLNHERGERAFHVSLVNPSSPPGPWTAE